MIQNNKAKKHPKKEAHFNQSVNKAREKKKTGNKVIIDMVRMHS